MKNRFFQVMNKAESGGSITIGFLGGSITQGSVAKSPENMYARRVFEWWEEVFPKAQFAYVNGGIGGTTSHYGVARAIEDLLMYQPDVVFVDFTVNDEDIPFFQETFEGLVRRIISWPSNPAVMVLNNVLYDTGVNAESQHNPITDYYKIPNVSMRDTIYPRIEAGDIDRAAFTEDQLHPTDYGHGLVATELIKALEVLRGKYEKLKSGIANPKFIKGILRNEPDLYSELPAPITANAYQNAKRYTIRNINPELAGFRADAEEKLGHLDHFKNGWIGKRIGDKITFEVAASCIAIQYRKTIQQPAPIARVLLDGVVVVDESGEEIVLDSNFDENWGDCLYLQPILHHGRAGRHVVELEIVEASKADQNPFYLMSLIVSGE